MGRADAPVHAPPGISGTCREAGAHPQTGEMRETRPIGVPCVADRALQRRRRPGVVGRLRGGFHAPARSADAPVWVPITLWPRSQK